VGVLQRLGRETGLAGQAVAAGASQDHRAVGRDELAAPTAAGDQPAFVGTQHSAIATPAGIHRQLAQRAGWCCDQLHGVGPPAGQSTGGRHGRMCDVRLGLRDRHPGNPVARDAFLQAVPPADNAQVGLARDGLDHERLTRVEDPVCRSPGTRHDGSDPGVGVFADPPDRGVFAPARSCRATVRPVWAVRRALNASWALRRRVPRASWDYRCVKLPAYLRAAYRWARACRTPLPDHDHEPGQRTRRRVPRGNNNTHQPASRLRPSTSLASPLTVAPALAREIAITGSRTKRKYRRTKKSLGPRCWRTRKDPFESVWPELQRQLVAEPERTVKSLFQELQQRCPDQFPDYQLRTLQRRVQQRRARAILEFDDSWLNDDVQAGRALPPPLRSSVDGADSPIESVERSA
jgi:hypothetical protein